MLSKSNFRMKKLLFLLLITASKSGIIKFTQCSILAIINMSTLGCALLYA